MTEALEETPVQAIRRQLQTYQLRLRGHVKQMETAVSRLMTGLDSCATQLADQLTYQELNRPPVADLAALIGKLTRLGPEGLSAREQRALVSSPKHMSAARLGLLLRQRPGLVQTVARVALSDWEGFQQQPWGELYAKVLIAHRSSLKLRLMESKVITPQRLWSRDPGVVEERLVDRLPKGSLCDVYRVLKEEWGLRDSWSLLPRVIVAWLPSVPGPLDALLRELASNRRLLALLLPDPQKPKESPPAVRRSVDVHALSVSWWLQVAFDRTPRLQPKSKAALLGRIMHSTFGDPRAISLSAGWLAVRSHDQESFGRFLASLVEQDLEVFFEHAMNEPDRRKFWLRYLPSIERTGCVLSKTRRSELREQLDVRPELQEALSRAYRYSHASNVQAFYLVFRSHVVVEFSDKGNAAYVYPRTYFERHLEQTVCQHQAPNVGFLKNREKCSERILHHGGWQGTAQDLLARLGIHPG